MNSGLYAKESNKFMIQGEVTLTIFLQTLYTKSI